MSDRAGPPRRAVALARRCLSPRNADRLIEALDDEYEVFQRPRVGRRRANLWYWGQVLRSILPLLLSGRRSGRSLVTADLRQLTRRLTRSPVSALAAVVTLALTLGVGASIVAVADQVLLRPPPFTDPHELFTLGVEPEGGPALASPSVAYSTLLEWRERADPRIPLEGYDPTSLTLTGLRDATRVGANDVTPGFFALLGIDPHVGRFFEDDDLGQRVVVVSHAFWAEQLGRHPADVGSQVMLGGIAHTVVGVLPQAFAFNLSRGDVWRLLPAAMPGSDDDTPVRVLGRLSADTPASAASLLHSPASGVDRGRVVATPISVALVGDSRRALVLLTSAAALAILIAFANLAVLLMVRSLDRRRELAVREALGARSSEAARQLAMEAVALVAIGVVMGILFAVALTPGIARYALELGGVAGREIDVSWRAIGVLSALAVTLGVACGVLPTLGRGRTRLATALRQGATSTRREVAVRRGFVAAEVAAAFVLLVSMGLLGTSLRAMLRTDPGFEATDVLKLQLSLPQAIYPDQASVVGFYRSLEDQLEARLPTATVGIIDEMPLSGDGGRSRIGLVQGDVPLVAVVRSATADYFPSIGIPLVEGRRFDGVRAPDALPTVLVTPAVARLWGPDQRVVGQRLWIDELEQSAEVIGVVGEVKHRALDEAELPTVYLSAAQFPSASSVVMVRSTLPPGDVSARIQEVVRRLDPELPVYGVETMDEVIAASPGVPARRLLTVTLTGFALLATALSLVGLFGLASHEVARRKTELALRAALGAKPSRLLRNTVNGSVRTVAIGLAVGLGLIALVLRALDTLLITSGVNDVLLLSAGVAVLLAVVGSAAALPAAVRAARSEPLTVLRAE